MFPSLHVPLFCPSRRVKKEGAEKRGEGREERGRVCFAESKFLYPSLDFVLDQVHNVCSVGP